MTEVVEVVVRERGARAVQGSIAGIGTTAKTAALAVGGLLTALAGFAAIGGLAQLATDAVQTAAAFEQFEVRLRTLLGSQEAANLALDNFTKLAAKTPFSVAQIVEGASTLAAVALGNREKLELLTQTAANLAAVTGLSFQEAASNLQRALSSGIGAADLFRERGVRQLIESIAGIPDATKLSNAELEAAFLATFGPNGTFATAASDLSNTLTGALSNVGDAATNLQKALGDAFAPAVIAAARQVIVPFLEALQKGAVDNEAALKKLAAEGVKFALEALVTFAEGGLSVIEVLDRVLGFLRTAAGAFLEFSVQVQRAVIAVEEATSFTVAGQSFSAFGVNLAEARSGLAATEAAVGKFAEGQFRADQRTAALSRTLDTARAGLGSFRSLLERADFTASASTGTPPNLPGGAAAGGGITAEEQKEIDKALRAQEAARARLVSLTDAQRIASQKAIEPLDGQLERLAQQREELLKQAKLAGDVRLAAEGVALVDAQVLEIEREKATLAGEQNDLFGRLSVLVEQIAKTSPEFANEVQRAARAAVEAGGGLEAVNSELRSLVGRASAELQREQQRVGKLGEEIGQTLADGVGSALSGVLEGEAVNFSEILADTSSKLLGDSLDELFRDLGKSLGGLLSKGTGGLFGGQGGAALGSALGLGFGLLSGALRGTESSVENDLVRSSAVESVQATRGVVAGDTSIPIAEVGASLEDALAGTNSLLAQILDVLRGRGTAGASANPLGQALGASSGSLF